MASILAGASNFTISGGTFSIHQNSSNVAERASAYDKLSAAAAHSAMHDAPARTDLSRCHQDTRINVLDHLERWAQGICDEGASVFWLHGGAGAGKSAVMQSLAERCVAQDLALGSFFFSRTDPTRNTAEVLIPTLAYQLAQVFPSIHKVLDPLINGNPLIFKKSLQVQLSTLFVRPLQHLVQIGTISDAPKSPRVFLIDGLDECSDSAQQQAIIQAVAAVCYEHHLPVKFLIASRPELAISTSFRWYGKNNRVLGAMSLSEDFDAQGDIRRFIEDEFARIRWQHPFSVMIPSEWPDPYDIDSLVWKSSSHFIYASTAMRYIWSAKENPVRSLQNVLSLQVSRTISPFSELDALYHHILGNAAHLDKVLRILAHYIVTTLYSPECGPPAEIICIMVQCSHDDLFVFMADVASLVVLPDSEKEITLRILHASLADFLCDQSRSGPWYIDREAYLIFNFEYCLQLMNHVCRNESISLPEWQVYTAPLILRKRQIIFSLAAAQILDTMEHHLAANQEVLKLNSLRDLHESQLCCRRITECSITNELDYLFKMLTAVHSINTPDGVSLFSSYLEDFLDILVSYISLIVPPLAPAILPLLFCGFPAEGLRKILFYHCTIKPSETPDIIAYQWFKDSLELGTALNFLATAGLASVRCGDNTSPECLALATETILGYLIDNVKLPRLLSTYPPHKTWMQQTKPRKHIATGMPRLASVIHAKWFRLYGFRQQRGKLTITVELLNALLLMLPKASFSAKIVLYSKRSFPWNMYQHTASLCRRVRRYLDRYVIRVRLTQLGEFNKRIEDGNLDALLEKSRSLALNEQD